MHSFPEKVLYRASVFIPLSDHGTVVGISQKIVLYSPSTTPAGEFRDIQRRVEQRNSRCGGGVRNGESLSRQKLVEKSCLPRILAKRLVAYPGDELFLARFSEKKRQDLEVDSLVTKREEKIPAKSRPFVVPFVEELKGSSIGEPRQEKNRRGALR